MFGGTSFLGSGDTGSATGLNGVTAGFNDTLQWTGETLIAAQQVTIPLRRAYHSMAYDPATRRVFVFGGFSSAGTRRIDTLAWDGYEWEVVATTAPQGSRSEAAFACTQGSQTRCLLFGGAKGSGELAQDTFEWNGSSWVQLQMANVPPARAGGAMAYLPGISTTPGRFVLVGGHGGSGSGSALGDAWQLLDGSNAWSPHSPAPPPGDRFVGYPSVGFDTVGQTLVAVIPGVSLTATVQNHTWTYSVAQGWIRSVNFPTLLTSPALAPNGSGRVVALARSSSQVRVATQVWDAATPTWLTQSDVRPSGGARVAAVVYDVLRGRTIILDQTRGVLEWTGTGVVGGAHANEPAARHAAGLAYDRSCGVTLAYGGAVNETTTPVASAVVYNGMMWTTASGTPPSARFEHAMAYDDVNDAVVVFGGRSTPALGSELDELWIWTGPCGNRTWTQVPRTTPWPPARTRTTLTYDPITQRFVLFGGLGTAGTLLGDTWELDGATWTWVERTPALAPSARSEHVMAFDARFERVVLFGGRTDVGVSNETWEWRGAEWERFGTGFTTTARAGAAAARDVSGAIVVFAGTNGESNIPGLIQLHSEIGFEPIERCLADADEDLDGLAGCADPDCWGRCHPMCQYGVECAGPRCGDGTCSVLEDYRVCPNDCQRP
ncbi:MAG: kelch repeat-containing protein [Kofleriaceae bacterium]